MSRFVVDSWAWIEYLNGTERGLRLKKAMSDGDELFTSIISLAEVLSLIRRKNMSVDVAENAIVSNSEIVNIDEKTAKDAAIFHGDMRKGIKDFGLGDAFVVIAARNLSAKILTGDPHFKNMKEAVMI